MKEKFRFSLNRFRNYFFVGLALASCFVAVLALNYPVGNKEVAEETWPEISIEKDYKTLVETSVQEFKERNFKYEYRLEEYDPFGNYLGYGSGSIDRYENKRTKLDENRLPLVRQSDGNYYFHPVMTAQYALTAYANHIQGEIPISQFLKAVDELVERQDEKGAFRYPFAWRYYLSKTEFSPGWVSGMAQGQAMSALARAYKVTKDVKYLRAGNRALEFMLTPVSKGGVMDNLSDLHPSLEKYLIFEEYISEPAAYTLNGFIFALLGLYDWWQINPDESSGSHARAKEYFAKGSLTLEKILPYFDIGGFTAYDLGHITYPSKEEPHIGINYHFVHVYLLHAMHSITKNPLFRYFELLWASYVE